METLLVLEIQKEAEQASFLVSVWNLIQEPVMFMFCTTPAVHFWITLHLHLLKHIKFNLAQRVPQQRLILTGRSMMETRLGGIAVFQQSQSWRLQDDQYN